MNDLFERGLRGELREREFFSHPSFAELFRYAQGRGDSPLGAEASEFARVSAHVVGCRRCQQELATLRYELAALSEALPRLGHQAFARPSVLERLRAAVRREELWGRPALYGHLFVYATAALLLIALNLSQLRGVEDPGYQGGAASWWVQWPLLAWGVLLAVHLWKGWRRR
jgi:anti-sigma factor RsiW